MRVRFRVDYAKSMGAGHLFRCLALAEQARARGSEVSFVSRDWGTSAQTLLRERAFNARILPRVAGDVPKADPSRWLGVDPAEDAEQTAQGLRPCEWVVVDHYGADASWIEAVRSKGARILAIDDLANRYLPADLIVNQNFLPLAQAAYEALGLPANRLLLGPRYALLRHAFSKARDRAQVRERIEGILLHFGGSDVHGMARRCVEALRPLLEAGEVSVTAILGLDARWNGPVFPGLKVKSFCPDIQEEMLRADLAIGAMGISAWERCALRLPAIAYTLAENQEDTARALAAEGIVVNLGPYSQFDSAALLRAVRALMQDPRAVSSMSRAGGELVDGLGTGRVLDAMDSNEST